MSERTPQSCEGSPSRLVFGAPDHDHVAAQFIWSIAKLHSSMSRRFTAMQASPAWGNITNFHILLWTRKSQFRSRGRETVELIQTTPEVVKHTHPLTTIRAVASPSASLPLLHTGSNIFLRTFAPETLSPLANLAV